ncbi:hypothetical protein ACHAXR_012176 [Thalassiosira sp. AJA248-18]
MLTTIPLSKWMSSRWAFASTSRQEIVSRKSIWSQQVENVYKGQYKGSGAETSQKKSRPNANNIYLENAAAIAFLLLEQILTIKETSGSVIELDSITVTVEIIQLRQGGKKITEDLNGKEDGHLHELCIIKFVNVVLHTNQDQRQPTFFQSLGAILLKLFLRQELLPNWGEFLPREEDDEPCEGGGYDDAEFESAMLKALSILDDEGEPRLVQRQKQQRQNNVESQSFSRIHNQYSVLPTSICRLISDLIDGPSRTKTSFASLNDVLDDLEQMATEPDTFLHEPTRTDVKLNFGNELYGRKEEVSQIIDIANDVSSRRETGPLELVSIEGYSGSGKSFLVRQVGHYLSSKGWIFIQGKFDRMRQRDSFSVVTSAFESFCGILQEMKARGNQNDLEYCSQVSTSVMDALGHTGVAYLCQIIPSLKKILDQDSGSDSDTNPFDSLNEGLDLAIIQTADEALMSQRKREYSLCVFVEAILGVGRKLLLFYDDLQWADASTLGFFRKLLKHLADRNKPRKNIMFAQSFRDDEFQDTEVLTSSIESCDSVNITKIKLVGFSKRALSDILSPVFGLPRRITSPLSEIIHQKTMGNIFFVIEFTKTLASPDKKIVTFSLSKRRWIWDTDTISVMTISDGVAGLLLKKLLRVEKSILDSLIIASCFGSQMNTFVMELLNGMRGVADIVQNLDAAVNEGLLEKAGPLFMFAHDSIQQSVYELTPKDELIKLHVDIGLMLISKGAHASRDMIEEIFLFALSHINMALPKCTSSNTAIEFTPSQHIVFAKLNLKAGQKAVNGKSNFSLAEVHLKAGISFLLRDSWKDQYDLTLQLFEEYANVLFVQRNLEEMHLHVEIILKNAKCIGDKIKAHELMISVLTLKGSTSEALDHAKSVLDSLGFPFPSSIVSETVLGVLKSLSSTTITFTPDHLRSFPLMTEKIPLQAMKIMSAVHMPYSFSDPAMFQMMACQMMQLTIKHGLCVESAEAFSNFGYCLISLSRDYEAGYRAGQLALVILDRFKATKRVAKVHFLIYGFLSVWKDPLQSTVEGLQYAVNMGLLEGDYESALFDQVVLNRQMFIAGYMLSVVRDRLLSLCRDMMYDKQRNVFFSGFNPVLADLYFVMSLTGETEDEVSSIFGITREENVEQLMAQYSASNNAPLVQLVYYHRLAKSFLFRDYDAALECCEQYDNYTLTRNLLRVTDIVATLFWGLSSMILSRRRKQSELMAKGEECLLKMQYWAKLGSKWNAENKALLLEAEYHFANGDNAKAETAYEQSIRSAHEHKFIHEEAIANELYGIFCVERGDMYKGNEHLEIARGLYNQWGAKKKAAAIFPL